MTLTLKGKITIVKSLIVPHILILTSCFPPSEKLIADIESLVTEFVWNHQKALIAKNTLMQPYKLWWPKKDLVLRKLFRHLKLCGSRDLQIPLMRNGNSCPGFF